MLEAAFIGAYVHGNKIGALTGLSEATDNAEEVAKEFNSKRNRITPDKVLPGSVKLYWWECRLCGEGYRKSPNYMTSIRIKRSKILHPRCKKA